MTSEQRPIKGEGAGLKGITRQIIWQLNLKCKGPTVGSYSIYYKNKEINVAEEEKVRTV